MKALTFLFAAAAASVSLVCQAAPQSEAPGLSEYIPCDGTIMKGSIVRAVVDDSFAAEQRKLVEKLRSMSPEKQKEIVGKSQADCAMEYDADLWPDRKDYDAYIAAWKKLRVVPSGEVVFSVKADDDQTMSILSLTRVQERDLVPLTISALRYDPKANVWTSNNGTLNPSSCTTSDLFAFGRQSGTEWKLEKSGDFTKVTETVRVTRSDDNKYVYILYSFLEQMGDTNTPIAQAAYLMRFSADAPSASSSKPGQK